MALKLITEEILDVAYLTEEVEGKKHHFIEGIFMQADIKNKNGRMYPHGILMKEAARYNREYIQTNRAFGELQHPEGPAINLDKVSHIITKLEPEGKNFMGKAKILDTPNGKIVKSLLDGGASLGVSTRGLGSLKSHNGCNMVQEDFQLVTAADVVASPSAPGAWVNGIMENYDFFMDEFGDVHGRRIEKYRKIIKEASQADIEAKSLMIFEDMLKNFIK